MRSEELNQIASEALENLSQEGIDSDEVTESRWTLERIQDLEIANEGHPVATLAKPIVTRAIAEMLKREGGYLTLDEIRSLASDLVEATRDPDMVRGTATLALKGFMGRLGENLSDVSSVSELDSFEGELQEVLRKYDIEYGYSPRYDVESRRETLQERESSQEDAGYRPVRAANPAEISDAEIASLFFTIERP